MRIAGVTLLVMVLASAGLLTNCTESIDRTEAEPVIDSPAGLPELPEEFAGWQAAGDPQHFVEDDLYLYINGGAVTWIECGFRQVVAREYANGTDARLTLEIFEMQDSHSAACIYQRRAGDGGETLELGGGGRLYDYYLEFHHGRFLVTITTLTAPGEIRPGLTALASEIDDLLIPRMELGT
jgi:hypothetical protein